MKKKLLEIYFMCGIGTDQLTPFYNKIKFVDGMAIGTRLSPSWNNEACSVCKKNHKRGYIHEICPYMYDSQCFVEASNKAINDKGDFNYFNSCALDTIVERFPELKHIKNNITIGTEKVYIEEFKHWFIFRKNYTDQIYLKD